MLTIGCYQKEQLVISPITDARIVPDIKHTSAVIKIIFLLTFAYKFAAFG